MFRKILVPLDGSPLAEGALAHAATVAATFEAQLLLLRVIPVRQRGGAAPMDIIDRRLCRAEAHAYLDAVAAGLRRRELAVDTEVVQGQPAEKIVEVLRSRGADLVVLTSHGMGGCTEFPISGTAHKVISRSAVSVLMVPTNEPTQRAAPAGTGYGRIMVGLDGSRRGAWAVGPAAVLARRLGAELLLAHVVQIPEVIEEPPSPELHAAAERLVLLNRQAASAHLAQAKSHLESSELRVRTRLEVSVNVPQTLAGIAEGEDADLVILTAHGASLGSQRPYGAIAIQILADARRPLLLAQDAEVPLARPATKREAALNQR